jgi:hypothetical protein
MKFRISSITDVGDIGRERLILRARDNANVGDYAIFRARAGKNDSPPLSGDIPEVYWFADRKVKRGDFVVLYTKSGSRSEKAQESGGRTYFYYWGLKSSIWEDSNFIAVLVETAEWESSEKK